MIEILGHQRFMEISFCQKLKKYFECKEKEVKYIYSERLDGSNA